MILLVLSLALSFAIASTDPASAQVPERLPDGEVTRAAGLSAWLVDPTLRYAHGVLGDAVEAGGFAVERDGMILLHRLDPDAVFEDRRVRLDDLDGDGEPEAIVVKSRLDTGAALAVYRIGADGIVPHAESPAIGQPNRWINPVGVGNFTGTGERMVAAVVTPHLAGSLRLYRLSGSALVEVARIDGYTNHVIGSRNLDLAVVRDVDGDGTPDIVLPTRDRGSVAAVTFRAGVAAEIARTPMEGRVSMIQEAGPGTVRVATEGGGTTIVDTTVSRPPTPKR
ncbi:MAG: hypothetical protein ACK5YI_10135 [Rhodospirillales bacterium]